MITAITTGISAIGSMVSGFFGFKGRQADLVSDAMQVIGDINASEDQRTAAVATIISSEASSGYWLSAVWRPLLMVIFAGFIVSFWFGYTPPNLTPETLDRIFDLLELGIGGYIGSRGVEKVVSSLGIASVLKTYIAKKLG